MAYDRVNWVNNASPPVSAENLNVMDAGIEDVDSRVTALEAVPSSTELGYDEKTDANSGEAVAGTSFATGTVICETAEISLDGSTEVEVEVFIPRVAVGTASWVEFSLSLDDAQEGCLGYVEGIIQSFSAKVRLTPAAGDHTFGFVARVNSGSGNIYCGPGGGGAMIPAFISVRRLG